MARKIEAIQQEMFDSIAANPNLAGLTSISKVAIWRLFIFVVAFAIWTLEVLFDTHLKEVQEVIQQDKTHRPSWYVTQAKRFQYGFALIPDTDKYDNTGYTDTQIEDSMIVKYAAATPGGGQVYLKIATEIAGVLAPLPNPEKIAFDGYAKEFIDMGVKYIIINHLPDILLLNIQIFRDPLILDVNGMSILNGNYPVQDAINEFMKELPFDGELVLFDLETKIKAAEGVVIPRLVNAESQSIDINTGVYNPAVPITVKTIPESGYFSIPDFNNIAYVV
jgi:hypothetical protein